MMKRPGTWCCAPFLLVPALFWLGPALSASDAVAQHMSRDLHDGGLRPPEMESDQDAGYCEACGGQTMVSALILAGLI
jgi:hypothetical protein